MIITAIYNLYNYVLIEGIGLLNIRKRLHAKRNLKQKSSFTPRVSPTPTPLPDEKFLNAFDLEVLEYKEHFYNRTSGRYAILLSCKIKKYHIKRT